MLGIVPQDQCIRLLEGDSIGQGGPMSPNTTPENALAYLKKVTGVDFGYDTIAWRNWFRENKPEITNWFWMRDDERYIAILEERPSYHLLGYITFENKKKACQRLIELTGQDFAYDGEAWRQWYQENRNDLAKRFVYG